MDCHIVGAPSRRGGHLVFPVSADTSPPTDVLHLEVGPILVRPLAAADARTASAKPFKHRATRPLPRLSARAASQEARPRPPALPSGNPPTAPYGMSARLTALEQGFTDHETRFQQRLVDQEMRTKSLESKVDEGFAKVLARLSTLQTGAQAST